jgi:hypothetical protein
MKTIIRGSSGETKGFILESNGRKDIFSPEGKRLGFYQETTNKTFTASGALVGFGDQTISLLDK